MFSSRWRPAVYSAVALAVLWVLAVSGFRMARNSRMTAEKVMAFVQEKDLRQLSAAERAKAIQELARRINALSIEERRKARLERAAMGWFEAMTEEEKGAFLEATMPTGFKQMLNSFEQLPEEKRRRAVQDALRQLRESQTKLSHAKGEFANTNEAALSPELQGKIRTIGLKTFYSQSSAQTKAELAPVLEELQRVMESGRVFRDRRGP